MALQSLIKQPMARLSIPEHAVRFGLQRLAHIKEIVEARGRLQQRRPYVSVGAEHRLAAIAQRRGVKAERATESLLADRAEEGRERFIRQRRAPFVLQRVLAPLPTPEDERGPIAADNLGADPQFLAREAVSVRGALRNPVEQRADRGERRRFARLVRPVDDVNSRVVPKCEARAVKGAEFVEFECSDPHRITPARRGRTSTPAPRPMSIRG